MRTWRGFCAACRKDLYTDPARHYATPSHLANAARVDRMEDADPRLVKMFDNVTVMRKEDTR
jgi:hypothetical protein